MIIKVYCYHIIVWNKQGITDESGKFSTEFAVNNTTGEYTIRLYNGKKKAVDNNAGSFFFVNKESFEKLISGLNTAAKNKTAEKYLSDNEKYFNIFDTENLSVNDIATLVEEEIKSGEFNGSSYGECKNRAALINLAGLLNESKIENIFEYTDVLSNIEEYVNFAEKNDYFSSEEEYRAVTKRMSGKNIKDIAELEEKLAEAMVLVIAEKPDGIDNITEALDILGDLAGADLNGAGREKIYNICGKSYGDIDEFNLAVRKSGSNKSNSVSSGGSGGGGSYGGGTKGKIVNADEILAEKNEVKESIPSDVYIDLDDAIWARNAIVSLTDKGYLRGRADGIFAPNENILREEFVKILICAFDNGTEVEENTGLSFGDVDENEWYYPYLVKAVAQGLVKGYSDELFGIGECITRQDMAVMIYRAAADEEKAREDYSDQFTDFAEVADYAVDAIYLFVEKGIINGMGDGTLCPQNNTTRAEAAKVIYEVIKQ